MQGFDWLHHCVDKLRLTPGVYQLRRRAYERSFATQHQAHMFRGVFDSFEAAAASAPPSRPTGYDNATSAAMYQNQLQHLTRDYPAALWLQQSFCRGHHEVVDLGGSLGIKFYAFAELMTYPSALRWRVIEVPAVVARGRELAAAKNGTQALSFGDDWREASGAHTLLASGSLQYLPLSLGEMLRAWSRPPQRLIVNTLPLHPARSYFTLNSIGTAYCPYRVQSEAEFLQDVCACGYRLIDRWTDASKQVLLPFEAGFDVAHYSGFCFERVDSPAYPVTPPCHFVRGMTVGCSPLKLKPSCKLCMYRSPGSAGCSPGSTTPRSSSESAGGTCPNVLILSFSRSRWHNWLRMH